MRAKLTAAEKAERERISHAARRRVIAARSYRKHRAKRKAAVAARLARINADAAAAKVLKRRYRLAQRAKFVTAGLTVRGTPRKRPPAPASP